MTYIQYLMILNDTVSSSLIMMAIAGAYTFDSQRQGIEIFPTWQTVIEKDIKAMSGFHLSKSIQRTRYSN